MRRAILTSKNRKRFPQVGLVFNDWTSALTFIKVSDEVIDFENVKTKEEFVFQGVLQPMRPQQIMLKPEGQRAWKWYSLWVLPKYDIAVGDEIRTEDGVTYRVMEKRNWEEADFIELELVQDYAERNN